MHGGDMIAQIIKAQGVQFVFTLTGGHISPILVGCKEQGLRVVDTRHEATAVFAADAVARLSGVPGVAVVTAGPGVTNTLTAVKNAQMAQSPLLLIGGAAPTMLRGRGALQDIDQLSVIRSAVKWSRTVQRVKQIAPTVQEAFRRSRDGVPGPVFVEIPLDLLYPEEIVRGWVDQAAKGSNLAARAQSLYLNWRLHRTFSGSDRLQLDELLEPPPLTPLPKQVEKVVTRLRKAERPLLVLGSQAVMDPPNAHNIAAAVEKLGIPVYLSGMARGLLGRNHPLQMRHQRRAALREADCILLAGVPADFRLGYGRQIPRESVYISINRSPEDLTRNRRPTLGVLCDPTIFLQRLATQVLPTNRWIEWQASLRARDDERSAEIDTQSQAPADGINPMDFCRQLEEHLNEQAVLVTDGGDFVATASYIVQPPSPLSWLDPGPFGTLGVGAGFALGAKLCRPHAHVWLLYGDGAAGYSLMEFDTFVRHGIPVTAVVGNDGGWTQIAREQVELLHDDVATVLAQTDYHLVAQALGGCGVRVDDPAQVAPVLAQATRSTMEGRPTLVNAILGKSDFRRGSISM